MLYTLHPDLMLSSQSVLQYLQPSLLSVFEVLLPQLFTLFLVLFYPLHLFHPQALQLRLHLLVARFYFLPQLLFLL